jgi:hypothetical protein
VAVKTDLEGRVTHCKHDIVIDSFCKICADIQWENSKFYRPVMDRAIWEIGRALAYCVKNTDENIVQHLVRARKALNDEMLIIGQTQRELD